MNTTAVATVLATATAGLEERKKEAKSQIRNSGMLRSPFVKYGNRFLDPLGKRRVSYQDSIKPSIEKPLKVPSPSMPSPPITLMDLQGKVDLQLGGMNQHVKTFFEKVVKPYQLKMKGIPVEHQKGVIFYGRPGNGKSNLASILARNIGCKKDFVQFIKSSDIDLYGSKNARNSLSGYFKKASENPQDMHILVFDEIDIIFKDTRNRIELQTLMSGCENNQNNFLVIGTTNESIDSFHEALLRAGRFSVHIHIGNPDQEQRLTILKHYANIQENNGVGFGELDFKELSKKTANMSAADIEQLLHVMVTAASYDRYSSETSCSPDINITLSDHHFYEAKKTLAQTSTLRQRALKQLPVNHEFLPSKEEGVIFTSLLNSINDTITKNGSYGVFVIKGNPGSGRTVFCSELIKQLTRFENYNCISEIDRTGIKCTDSVDGRAKKALDNSLNYDSSLIIIDTIDNIKPDGSAFVSSKVNLSENWRKTVEDIGESSIALVLTTSLSREEVDKLLDINHIRGFFSLPEGIDQDNLQQILTSMGMDTASQSEITKMIKNKTSYKELLDLLQYCKKETELTKTSVYTGSSELQSPSVSSIANIDAEKNDQDNPTWDLQKIKSILFQDKLISEKNDALRALSTQHSFIPIEAYNEIIDESIITLKKISEKPGRVGIIVIQGDSGTGKTALCHKLVEAGLNYDHFNILSPAKIILDDGGHVRLDSVSDILSKCENFKRSLIVIEDIEKFMFSIEELNKVFNLYLKCHEKSSVALVITSSLPSHELKGTLSDEYLRNNFSLPLLNKEQIKELMAKMSFKSSEQEVFSQGFKGKCTIRNILRALDYYEKPSKNSGSRTWDFEGMRKQYPEVESDYSSQSMFS